MYCNSHYNLHHPTTEVGGSGVQLVSEGLCYFLDHSENDPKLLSFPKIVREALKQTKK